MKILVLGSGLAEHALIWKLLKSKKHILKILAIPGNIGIEDEVETLNIDLKDIDRLLEIAIARQIDLTIVGEAELFSLGICDKFREAGKLILGPSKAAAEIEYSQSFAKNLILENEIPSYNFASFDDMNILEVFLSTVKFPVLIRADNPFLFKEPIIKVRNLDEAYLAVERFYRPSIGSRKVIVEDCPKGDLFSINLISDSHRYIYFPSVHSYRFDFEKNDHNPGFDWGAYAPTPLVNEDILKSIDSKIINPCFEALSRSGRAYQGLISFDIFLEEGSKPKLFQLRSFLASSDAQVILPLLDEELVDVLSSAARFNISFYEEGFKTYHGSALNVNLLSNLKSWTDNSTESSNKSGSGVLSRTEDFIEGIPLVFFNKSTDLSSSAYEPLLGATALAENLLDAQIIAYKIVDKVSLPDKQYKSNIGDQAML